MSVDPTSLLTRMLEIESVTGREALLARFLVRVMATNGFEAYVDDAGNAVGVREGPPSDGPTRELVLLGHMDTVAGRIPVRRDGDLLYGRGAVDAKGPLAAFVAAAAAARLDPGARVVVIGAVEEEGSSAGARFAATRFRPDACVIGEPSGWDAVTIGYKGSLRVRYRAERSAGHSAGPDGGVAETVVDWWTAARALVGEINEGREALFDRLQGSLLRVETTSDGLTDAVEATAGFRLPPGLDAGALLDALRASATAGEVVALGSEPPYSSSRATPIGRPFLTAIRAAGGEPRFKLKTGTSDMNVVGPVWRCPIVAYGPGDSRLDHTPDEHVSVAELLRATEVLRSAIHEITRASAREDGGDRGTGEIRDHRFDVARG